MGLRGKYLWRVPQGYVGIKFTPFCLKVTYDGELLYFDRNLGQTVREEEVIGNMCNLNEAEQLALKGFLERYPTKAEKILFWCNGIQRTGRTLLKKYARELEQVILSQKFMKENTNNSTQRKVTQSGSV
jgi:hypothetical protein